MSENGNDSKRCEELRAELETKMMAVKHEDDALTKCEKLEGIVLGTCGGILSVVGRLSRRIPRRPWIVNVVGSVLGGITLLTVVGLAWTGGARLASLKAEDIATRLLADSACAKSTRADSAARSAARAARRAALRGRRVDGNLERLMRAQGLQPLPPVPDSADSIP